MTSREHDVLGRTLTRRGLLFGGAALAAAGGAAAAIELTDSARSAHIAPVAVGNVPAGLPDRQFAWNATLARDQHGNPVAPRFDRLLFFDVEGRPGPDRCACSRRRCARSSAASRGVRAGCCSPSGGARRTSRGALGANSPIPRGRALSDFELPTIDNYDLCLHLAGDDEPRLADIEAALLHGAQLAGRRRAARHLPAALQLARDPHRLRRRRTARRPPGRRRHPVRAARCPRRRRCSWASSRTSRRTKPPRTTSPSPPGRSPQGTTMHVSYMRLRLDSWYQDLEQTRARRPHVRAPDDPRAGRATSPPTPPATPQQLGAGDQPPRRDRPRADLRPRPPQRQATDHPPRLQHRRRRPGRPALRLAATHDRRLRHAPAPR